jgi:hypothetical protein
MYSTTSASEKHALSLQVFFAPHTPICRPIISLNTLKMVTKTMMASDLSALQDQFNSTLLQRAEEAELRLNHEQQENAKLRYINAELSGENDEVAEEVQEMVEEIRDLYDGIHAITQDKLLLQRLNEDLQRERDELFEMTELAMCPSEDIAQQIECVRQKERASVHAVLAEKMALEQHTEQITRQKDEMEAVLDFLIRKQEQQQNKGGKQPRSWSFLGNKSTVRSNTRRTRARIGFGRRQPNTTTPLKDSNTRHLLQNAAALLSHQLGPSNADHDKEPSYGDDHKDELHRPQVVNLPARNSSIRDESTSGDHGGDGNGKGFADGYLGGVLLDELLCPFGRFPLRVEKD